MSSLEPHVRGLCHLLPKELKKIILGITKTNMKIHKVLIHLSSYSEELRCFRV